MAPSSTALLLCLASPSWEGGGAHGSQRDSDRLSRGERGGSRAPRVESATLLHALNAHLRLAGSGPRRVLRLELVDRGQRLNAA